MKSPAQSSTAPSDLTVRSSNPIFFQSKTPKSVSLYSILILCGRAYTISFSVQSHSSTSPMLCSVPAGKSGSSWLNRLRSNKGFPTGDDDLDLDHFLSQNPNSSSSDSPHLNSEESRTIPTRPEPQRVSNRSGGQEREWVGVMSNVLSELFFMGGSGESSRLSGKKFPRKQTNPRICVVSSDNSNSSVVGERKKSSDGAVTASFNSDGNSPMMRTKEGNVGFGGFEVEDDEDDDDDGEEEEEKGEKELKGYSRSEVTVIDTSFGCWKSEKLVFRRKNVWKVREKKGKLRSFGRKKRKGGSDSTWGAVGLEKKAKVLASSEANGDQSVKISSDEGQNLKNDSMEEVCKATAENLNTTREEISTESPDKLSQDFRRRSRFSGSPRKVKKGGSSVVLIKGIPNLPRSTQRQHKA